MRGLSTITHHSRMEDRHPALSEERRQVEDVLRNATEPLTPKVITSRSSVERARVTIVLQRLRLDGLAVNLGTPAKPRWRWRANANTWRVPGSTEERLSRSSSARGTYDGAELRPLEGRPGAMDFKKWPSRGLV